MDKIRMQISGRDTMVTALMVLCAFGKIEWGWFWLAFIIDEICGITFITKDGK